jgi:hypothetical protein
MGAGEIRNFYSNILALITLRREFLASPQFFGVPALQNGFNLIELLIASFLGLMLWSGIAQIYFSMQVIFRMQTALAQIQENGRYAVHLLSTQIRMAGYPQCGKQKGNIDSDKIIKKYTLASLPNYLKDQVIVNHDILVIWQCRMIHNQDRFTEVAYFISDTYRRNKLGKPIFALFEKPKGGTRRELVANIANMQTQWISEGNSIKALAINLLLTSEETVFLSPQGYHFNGIHYHDSLLRKVWPMYIALQNA